MAFAPVNGAGRKDAYSAVQIVPPEKRRYSGGYYIILTNVLMKRSRVHEFVYLCTRRCAYNNFLISNTGYIDMRRIWGS